MSAGETEIREKVQLLRSMERAMRGPDKRKAPRSPIRLAVRVRLVGRSYAGTWSEGNLWDISPRGARLSTHLDLKAGDSIAIRFPAKLGSAAPAPLLCRVAHCQARKNESTFAGLEFITKLA